MHKLLVLATETPTAIFCSAIVNQRLRHPPTAVHDVNLGEDDARVIGQLAEKSNKSWDGEDMRIGSVLVNDPMS